MSRGTGEGRVPVGKVASLAKDVREADYWCDEDTQNLAQDHLDLRKRFTAMEDQADREGIRAEDAERAIAALTAEVQRLRGGGGASGGPT